MAALSLRIVRVWIPVGMVLGGLAMVVISPDVVGLEGAAFMIGGAAGIAVSNRLHRMSISGEKDRVGESDAREFLDRYGVWPDQATREQLAEARASGLFDGRGAGPRPAEVAAPAPRRSPHRRAGEPPGRRRPAAPSRTPPRRPGPHDLRR